MLAERAETRSLYHDLEDAGGEWAPPLVVRERMSDWDFAEATSAMTIASDAIAARDRIIDTLAASGTGLPSQIEGNFESAEADDLDRLMDRLAEHEASSIAIAEAYDALTADCNVIESIGSWLADDEVVFDTAQTEFENDASADALTRANLVSTNVADYQTKGTIRVAGTLVVLLLLAGGTWFLRTRRQRRATPVDAGDDESAQLPVLPEVETLVGGGPL
ncbi:MAG: hypothetical protein R2706_04495 [Acidimicrobiales bacterium]